MKRELLLALGLGVANVLNPTIYSAEFQYKTSQYSVHSDIIGDLNRLHRHIWAKGGICRHAATAVVFAAESVDLETRIVQLGSANYKPELNTPEALKKLNPPGSKFKRKVSYKYHAIPLVKYNGHWHVFETFKNWSSYKKSETIPEDPSWYKDIVEDNSRKFIPDYFKEIAFFDEKVRKWAKELDNICPGWREKFCSSQ